MLGKLRLQKRDFVVFHVRIGIDSMQNRHQHARTELRKNHEEKPTSPNPSIHCLLLVGRRWGCFALSSLSREILLNFDLSASKKETTLVQRT